MGYYSDFEIITNRKLSEKNLNKVIELLNEGDQANFEESTNVCGNKTKLVCFDIKFYGEKETIKKVSEMLPNILFSCKGCGEDGDMWMTYGRGGKVERVGAIIKYPKPTI